MDFVVTGRRGQTRHSPAPTGESIASNGFYSVWMPRSCLRHGSF